MANLNGDSAWMQLQVVHREEVASDVVLLQLRLTSGLELPAFEAGAHIDLELPNGMVRQYSLCNGPANREVYELGVLRECGGRGGSKSVHEELHVGVKVRAKPPRNLFELEQAAHSILLAGGIGITPLLSMAEHLESAGKSFEMHVCARSLERLPFASRIDKSSFRKSVSFHLDDGTPEQRFDALRYLREAPSDSRIYVCGPKGFIDYVRSIAESAGFEPSRIHSESFMPEEAFKKGDHEFVVVWKPTGQVVKVGAQETVATALQREGIAIELSCEQGICGTCVLNVVSGTPDHRDSYFSDEEHANSSCFTACCSRARSSQLVLEPASG